MNGKPLFTRRAELILGGWLFAFCMSFAILQQGCRTPDPAAPGITITQLAACALVDRLPQSAGYLTAAAGVFHEFATAEALPSPSAVRDALAAIPNARLTPAQQELLWGATVVAYQLAHRAARTPADWQNLRGNLELVSIALSAAVRDCALPTSSGLPRRGDVLALDVGPAVDEQGLFDLSKTIGKQLSK